MEWTPWLDEHNQHLSIWEDLANGENAVWLKQETNDCSMSINIFFLTIQMSCFSSDMNIEVKTQTIKFVYKLRLNAHWEISPIFPWVKCEAYCINFMTIS